MADASLPPTEASAMDAEAAVQTDASDGSVDGAADNGGADATVDASTDGTADDDGGD